MSGRQLRQEILNCGPAFLAPDQYSEPDAFQALVTVLAAYSLGSRTASRLVRERQAQDPKWQAPSRREAMQVVSSLNRLRQYLPYLLGQQLQAAAAAVGPNEGLQRPKPIASMSKTGRREVGVVTPPPRRVSQPVVKTRPSPSGVVVRPVVDLKNRSS
jgi:hypothetical protein